MVHATSSMVGKITVPEDEGTRVFSHPLRVLAEVGDVLARTNGIGGPRAQEPPTLGESGEVDVPQAPDDRRTAGRAAKLRWSGGSHSRMATRCSVVRTIFPRRDATSVEILWDILVEMSPVKGSSGRSLSSESVW